jgi:hypothetical protein
LDQKGAIVFLRLERDYGARACLVAQIDRGNAAESATVDDCVCPRLDKIERRKKKFIDHTHFHRLECVEDEPRFSHRRLQNQAPNMDTGERAKEPPSAGTTPESSIKDDEQLVSQRRAA